MEIKFNVTGERRKALVTELGKLLLWEPEYKKAPTFEYVVGNYRVDRFGTITCPECATPEIVRQLLANLNGLGFVPAVEPEFPVTELPLENDMEEVPDSSSKDLPFYETAEQTYNQDETDTSAGTPEEDPDKLEISIPISFLDDAGVDRLRLLINSKKTLLRKVFQTNDLSITLSPEKISFPWFTRTGNDAEVDAYTKFVTALCVMARDQKRITAKEREQDNDKFTMRLFLIRLGFIGDEYKSTRKFLLRNLTGNCSWKSGHAPEKRCNQTYVAETAAEAAVVLTASNIVEPVSSDNKEGDSTLE